MPKIKDLGINVSQPKAYMETDVGCDCLTAGCNIPSDCGATNGVEAEAAEAAERECGMWGTRCRGSFAPCGVHTLAAAGLGCRAPSGIIDPDHCGEKGTVCHASWMGLMENCTAASRTVEVTPQTPELPAGTLTAADIKALKAQLNQYLENLEKAAKKSKKSKKSRK